MAVARRRSFRAASSDLGVSPTVLSQTITGLEARLGVRLFNRTTRSVSPTNAGEQFLAEVEPGVGANMAQCIRPYVEVARWFNTKGPAG
jgi:DNA-binding transcriptional LysR family regulator